MKEREKARGIADKVRGWCVLENKGMILHKNTKGEGWK